jgi:hypothetical protein
MPPRLWESFRGDELEDMFLRSEDLGTVIPRGSAIYAWRRLLTPPSSVASNPALLTRWIAECVKIPAAKLPRQDVAHFLSLDGVSLGGSPLTEDKLATLKGWLTESRSRKFVADVVASITELVPPLYVGETDDLPRRIKEHIAHETDFSCTLASLGLKWSDCKLYVCPVPAEFLTVNAKARRTLIEMVVSRLAIAGCTSRPG